MRCARPLLTRCFSVSCQSCVIYRRRFPISRGHVLISEAQRLTASGGSEAPLNVGLGFHVDGSLLRHSCSFVHPACMSDADCRMGWLGLRTPPNPPPCPSPNTNRAFLSALLTPVLVHTFCLFGCKHARAHTHTQVVSVHL